MPNVNLAYEILTQFLSLAHNQFLIFQTHLEISITGLRVRFVESVTLLSAIQATADFN